MRWIRRYRWWLLAGVAGLGAACSLALGLDAARQEWVETGRRYRDPVRCIP